MLRVERALREVDVCQQASALPAALPAAGTVRADTQDHRVLCVQVAPRVILSSVNYFGFIAKLI